MRLETLIIIGVLFGVPASAAYRVQQITQVPTEPGQTLSSMVVDSHGNTIVGATTATSAFVISLDPSGNRRFTHALSVSGPLALALDSNDDIYAAGAGGAFKLSGLDGGVVYATSLPASGPFFSANITVDRAGQAVLAIGTAAADTATTPGAYVSPRDSGIADSATPAGSVFRHPARRSSGRCTTEPPTISMAAVPRSQQSLRIPVPPRCLSTPTTTSGFRAGRTLLTSQ